MIGKKFNMLTVLEELPERKHGNRVYRCRCDCGNIKDVRKDMLKNGHVKSCGCLQRKIVTNLKTKHGKVGTRLYRIFYRMKDRCYNKNNKRYKDYGERNIIICDEWRNDFQAFYDWAINNNYRDDLTIDRIDNDGNYEPNNCRWVNRKTQQNNTRYNVLLTYDGKTRTMKQWAEELHLCYQTLFERHKRGWSDKECLFGKE